MSVFLCKAAKCRRACGQFAPFSGAPRAVRRFFGEEKCKLRKNGAEWANLLEVYKYLSRFFGKMPKMIKNTISSVLLLTFHTRCGIMNSLQHSPEGCFTDVKMPILLEKSRVFAIFKALRDREENDKKRRKTNV